MIGRSNHPRHDGGRPRGRFGRAARVLCRLALLSALSVAACGGGDLTPLRKAQGGSAPQTPCDELTDCGVDPNTLSSTPCTGFGLECFHVAHCNTAKCVQPAHVCQWECRDKNCMVMESFPAQIGCGS